MSWHPIIFDGESIRAILAGDKTQTRRIAKMTHGGHVKEPRGHRRWHPGDPDAVLACPYGVPGDMLWVRETWARVIESNNPNHIEYRADWDLQDDMDRDHTWRSPIHMPREYSRISLRVTDVRVQRLQEISRDDVIAEGVTQEAIEHEEKWFHRDDAPALAYAQRWDAINGKRAPWATNPFVWAVTFERA